MLNWTRDELAARSGIHVKAIARFEAGETRRPHPRTRAALVAAFAAAGITFITADGVLLTRPGRSS
jgi:transcriptional regulator with XRE-family HTH domain